MEEKNLEETLAFLITVFYKDFARYCGQRLQQAGLSRGLLFFLLYIGKDPGCAPGRLSEALDSDNGHTTRSVAKLVERGFVKKERSSSDKRAWSLTLTPQGREAYRLCHELFSQWDRERFGGLPEEAKTAVRDALRSLLDQSGMSPFLGL